MLGALFTGKH